MVERSRKIVWLYSALVLNIASILICLFIILGSFYIQRTIIQGLQLIEKEINNIYGPVYTKVSDLNNFSENLATEYDTVKDQITRSGVSTSPALITTTSNKLEQFASTLQDYSGTLDAGSLKIDSINTRVQFLTDLTGIRIRTIESTPLASLSERLSNTAEKLEEASAAVGKTRPGKAVSGSIFAETDNIIYETLDRAEGLKSNLELQKNNFDSFVWLIRFWTLLGTAFIIGFFLWSLYNFIANTKTIYRRIKPKRKG